MKTCAPSKCNQTIGKRMIEVSFSGWHLILFLWTRWFRFSLAFSSSEQGKEWINDRQMKSFTSSKREDRIFPSSSTSIYPNNRADGEMSTSTDLLTDHLFIILILSLALIFVCSTSIYYVFNADRMKKRRQFDLAVSQTRAAYSEPRNRIGDRRKAANENSTAIELDQQTRSKVSCDSPSTALPWTYRTFDCSTKFHRKVSSDSSLSIATTRQTSTSRINFESIKSKLKNRSTNSDLVNLQLVTRPEKHSVICSDDDDQIDSPSTETRFGQMFESTIAESFRLDLFYKVFYSIDEKQLFFQLTRLKYFQPLIERNFPCFICKIRLFTDHGKKKSKKYLSKKNPLNEIFKFDLDQFTLDQSYLKVHIIGVTNNDKQLELAHLVLILSQHENLMIRSELHHSNGLHNSEEHKKTANIDQDRIDMIVRSQVRPLKLENLSTNLFVSARFFRSIRIRKVAPWFVWFMRVIVVFFKLESSKSSEWKVWFDWPTTTLIIEVCRHFESLHFFCLRVDLIQIKISTSVDGKVIEKSKSKGISVDRTVLTSNAFFPLDYLSLHKTSVTISFHYRRSSIRTQSKLISKIDFGSTQLKNQQTFQHWTDTLSNPNRAHIQWHTLSFIESNWLRSIKLEL